MNKDQIAGHLEEFKYILGADTLIKELVSYYSAAELTEFVRHVEQHYDINYYEELLVKSFTPEEIGE